MWKLGFANWRNSVWYCHPVTTIQAKSLYGMAFFRKWTDTVGSASGMDFGCSTAPAIRDDHVVTASKTKNSLAVMIFMIRNNSHTSQVEPFAMHSIWQFLLIFFYQLINIVILLYSIHWRSQFSFLFPWLLCCTPTSVLETIGDC